MDSGHIDSTAYDELRAVMGDAMLDLIETFIEESARQLATTRQGFDAGDFEAVRRNIHSLKGSAANVGARELNRICEHIERRARDGDAESITMLLNAAEAELTEVSNALTAMSP